MKQLVTKWLPIVLTCGVTHMVAAADRPADLPRYRLEPGQEFTYRQTSDFHYSAGKREGTLAYRTDWQVWVVGKNADGSRRLVFRAGESVAQATDDKKASERTQFSMCYCDVFPDGRLAATDSVGFRMAPWDLFPRLPDSASAAEHGWKEELPRDATVRHFRAEPKAKTGSASWAFRCVQDTALDKIYVMTWNAQFFFDAKLGRLERAETENTQGYGFNGKGTGKIVLLGVKEHDTEWTQKFAAEAETYFAASQVHEKLADKAERDVDHVDGLLDLAARKLKEARGAVTLPLFQQQLDADIKTGAMMAKYTREECKQRAEFLNKPAADWEVADLAGKPHALKHYHGKVVVMDFWYRGCGWCMRAMPQVNRLAHDFQDRPVAFLGMNTDRQSSDAELVVKLMDLGYPVLKAEGLPKKYGVQGFPTMIIIDQEGVIRDVHVGYTPTLYHDVAEIVQGLLNNKNTK